MNGIKALDLIKSQGIYGLCESDGCPCCWFEIHGVNVEVSCHKSERSIRVFSHHLYRNPFHLEPIAVEVACQIGRDGYKIRFCEYACDHTGDNGKCCYCSNPRKDKEAYLCPKCLKNPDARGSYPWGLVGNMVPPQEQERSMFAPLMDKATVIVLGEKELRAMAQELGRKPN